MQRIVLVFIALVALTFAQYTGNTTAYCTGIIASCDASIKAYKDVPTCVKIFDNLIAADGVDAATSGDTRACRIYHAGVAATTPDPHCTHGGGTGGGACTSGDDCDIFCNQNAIACGNRSYPDVATCKALCKAFPRSTPQYDLYNNTATNTLECRWYHFYAGYGSLNDLSHCDHSTQSGDTHCGDLTDVYCQQYTTMCGSTITNCKQQAAALPLGTLADKSGNTLYCRLYHIGAGYAANATAVHCPHGSPVSGSDICGTGCEGYCSLIQSACTGANQQYTDNAACLAACAKFPTNGTDGATSGDSLQCRTYHLGVAFGIPDPHCSHAGLGAGVCGGSAASTKSSTSNSGSGSGTNSVSALVVGVLALIACLLI